MRPRSTPRAGTTLAVLVVVAALAACTDGRGSANGARSTTDSANPAKPADPAEPADSSTGAEPVCRGTGTAERIGERYAAAPGADANAQSLDVYSPVVPDDCPAAPIVVYVHGGGFRNGDKRNKVDDKIRLFNDEGWVFASVNYRLVGKPSAGTDGATYPRQAEDLASAIAWLAEHATEIGGDPTRIMLMGHSAGAFLVALTSTDGSFLTRAGVDPAAVICTVPLDTETFDVRAQIDGGGSQAAVYRATFGDDPAVWDAASPLRNLDDDEPLPRFLFFTRGNDRRAEGNRTMAAAITAAGGQAEVVDAEPYTHEEVNTSVGASGDTVVTPPLMAFFRSCAGEPAGAPDRGDERGEPSGLADLTFTRDWRAGSVDEEGNLLGGTELMNLAAFDGQLFAGTGFWKDDPNVGPPVVGAQVLVKERAGAPWRLETTLEGFGRVETLDTIRFTTDGDGEALDEPAELLIAGGYDAVAPLAPTVFTRLGPGRWASTAVPDPGIVYSRRVEPSVRNLQDHVDQETGVSAVFAGLSSGQIVRGVYDADAEGLLRWDPEPELTAWDNGRIWFAEANGELFATVGVSDSADTDGGVYRRIDGAEPRWERITTWELADPDEAGVMRGITAVPAEPGSDDEVLIAGRQDTGTIVRITPDGTMTVDYEWRQHYLDEWGDLGGGASLAAYNDMPRVTDPATGRPANLIGVWIVHPDRYTPPNNGSHYLVRYDDGTYAHGVVDDPANPVPAGQELRATRAIVASPFPGEEGHVFYFGGFDAGGARLHQDTAWIYRGEA